MAELNDQYLNSLRVAIFQFTRESSNFTSVLTEVFDNLDKSTTQSSKTIDNSTKSVKGFGDAISSSSSYLKDFKSYVSNNSKNIAESSKAVKEYTSQLAELKQKSADINRNWGTLSNSLTQSYGKASREQQTIITKQLQDYYDRAGEIAKADWQTAPIEDIVHYHDIIANIIPKLQNELKNLSLGKEEINAKIKTQNQELYKNIYDTFGHSLLTIDSLITEKTSSWKGLKGSIDELAKDAFKDTALNISKEFQKNGIPGLHDYNKALTESLLSLERTGGVIDESNFLILDKFQQFAEKVGDSSESVKNINDALNAHVESIVKGAIPSEAKTTINGNIVDELSQSYQGNIDALDKFSKSINKTFTKHQIAFSTIIDKQLSEQSNIFGKFIYNFGKGAVQGGPVGTTGMENAFNEFTGTMRAGLLPALKGIIETSKGFIKRETDAFADFIELDRTSALKQQMGEEETIKLLSDTKPIWQTMEGGIGEFNEYQNDLLDTAKRTLGTNVDQRNAIEKANFENLQALGLLSRSVDKSTNEELLKSMMVDMQKISAGGGFSIKAQSDMMNNVVKSSAVLKASAMLDKDRKRAQYEEIQNTIKFASVLKMTADQASTVTTALASMNTNMTRQQMVVNAGAFMQMKTIVDAMGEKVGITTGISDEDMNKMTSLLQTKSTRPEDQEFIRDTMFGLVAKFKDTELKYREEMDKARERGDIAAVEDYNARLASIDDLVASAMENFSGPAKDVIQKFAESYPTSKEEYAKIDATRKEGETFQQAMVRYVDTEAKKNITKQDTTTNNFEKSVTDFGNYVTAFGKNIFGAQFENLFTVLFNGFAGIAEFGIAARALTTIFGAGGAAAGAAGAGGLGAAAAAVLPEVLAALGVVGGVAMFAYGVKGLYDHVVGNDIIYKADRGDAIHGMVDVNNLDIYTNQVTDAIDKQTQDLLKGFTSIIEPPKIINTNEQIVTNTTIPFSGYKPYNPPNGGNTTIPFSGYKPYNPPNGGNTTNIEQPQGPLMSTKINNVDTSLALEDLKTFLTKELINGLMENMVKIAANTGNTATNTGNEGPLVDILKRPASQPFVRGTVENAATLTG